MIEYSEGEAYLHCTLELKSFGTLYDTDFTIVGVPTFSSCTGANELDYLNIFHQLDLMDLGMNKRPFDYMCIWLRYRSIIYFPQSKYINAIISNAVSTFFLCYDIYM